MMKTLTRWLRVIGGILLLPFLLIILLILKPIEWLVGRFLLANKHLPAHFQAIRDEAEAAEARYQQGEGVAALNEAIAAWEQILNDPEFANADAEEKLSLSWVLNDSAGTYWRRYQATGVLADLDKALSSWEELANSVPSDSPHLPAILNNLGVGLSDRYQRTGALSDLDDSIANAQQAVELTPEGSPDLPSRLNNLGSFLSYRYQRTGALSDLDDSIANAQQAVELTQVGEPNLPMYLNNLGNRLSDRYQRTGALSDLDDSIANAQQAVELTPEGSPKLPMYLNNLGNRLSNRYQRTGALSDLDDSIANAQQAVELTKVGEPGLPMYLNNLGRLLSYRYQRTGALSDLDDSIANAQQAVELTPEGSPDLPMYLNNLGSFLSYRYQRTGALSDLDDSIANAQQAVELTPEGSPDLPMYLNNLGSFLSDRYQRTGALSDLDDSIANAQQAVELTPEGSPSLPMYLNNLGNKLSYRYQHIGALSDLQQGIAAYKKAAQRGLEVALEEGLISARKWLRWAFRRQAWDEVVEAYDYAFKASTRLVQTQLTRQHQTQWLKESQGLAAHAAYALAQQNKLTDAVVTLERGLAQLLSEALARDRAELEQLKDIGHSDLYDSYQQAINDWHDAQQLAGRLEHPTAKQSEKIRDSLRAASKQLDNTIAAIRQLDGYADFLAAPGFADISKAVNNTRLVYIAATEAGGLALIVDNNTITPVWLPELTEASLEQTLVSLEAPHRGYLRAYEEWRRDSNDETHRTEWFDALEQTTQLLWQRIMAPIIEVLPESAAITLIPVGRLGLLPLHAAWTDDSTAPTGKRYALDVLTISYAPNARALSAAQQVAARISPDTLLAIEEPLPVNANRLPSAPYETQTVISTFKQHQVLKNAEATRAAVLAALLHCNVLHFSCHGRANLQKPLQSGLIMANDKFITVKDILDLRLNGVRLATLSACETGIPGTELPEEVVNLPAGLLQAGIAGVAASLWSVNDFSTMMLMAYFYDRWRIDQLEPAEALRQAQIWMRDTTNAQKKVYFKQLLDEQTSTIADETKMAQGTAKVLRQVIMLKKPTDREFEHPFYWAAFGLVGV